MASVEDQVGEPIATEKEYVDIIRSDTDVDKEFIKDTGVPAKIIYYCRDCKDLVKPKRIGKKFQFSCTACKGSNVSFGSEKSIEKYYKVEMKEAKKEK